jgi:hypothetical protein
MKHVLLPTAALALAVSLGACDQSATTETAPTASANAASTGAGIDGTWVIDLDSGKFEGKPMDIVLADGTYTCANCTPPLTVAADGAFHDVAGRDVSDAVAIKVDNDRQITMSTRRGDLALGSTVMSVSPDGKTLTRTFTDTSNKDAKPVTGSSTMTRVGDAPAGAHAISGKWQMAKMDKLSEEAMTVTFASTPDGLKMTSGDGYSWDAKFDGSDTPVVGDVAGGTVALTKTGDNTYRMVSKLKGKEVGVSDFTVAGNTLTYSSTDPRSGEKTSYTATRK